MSLRHGRQASRRAAAWPLAGLLTTVSVLSIASAAHADTADATSTTDASATAVGGVVVTAAPREEAAARAVELAAPNVVRVQSAETILKYPDFNAAEALGRIPDVSLSSDTGEGRFVQIRGIDANLDGATYGGIPLLNTNPGGTAAGGGGRAVEYDTIPTGAIDGIVVTLTGLPDHEAEGLGGSIELSPRTAARIDKPFVDMTLGGGYEPLHAHGGPWEGAVAIGARFGIGDGGVVWQNGQDLAPRAGFISNPTPFSFVINASYKEDHRAIDDLEESYLNDGVAPANGVSEYDLRRYDYHRRRFGYGGEFDFEPNDDHRWYVRADIAGYTESVHKNFLLFTNMADPTPNPAATNGFLTTMTPTISLTDEEETHRNQVYVIGGEDRFGDVHVDYHAAYSRATFTVPRNTGVQFAGPTVALAYDNVTTPNFPIFSFPGGFNVNDATQYTLASGGVSANTDYDQDYEWSFAGNVEVPLHFLNGDDQLKFGSEVRLRTKSTTEIDSNFGLDSNGDEPPISLATVSFPAIQYYDNHYSNGPFINLNAIRSLIATGLIPQFAPPTFNQGSFIKDTEDIYAGYGEFVGQWGAWGLLAGVRVEATDAHYGAFVTDALGNTAFDNRPVGYVNAFPTVQLKYTFSPTLVARATYSTGISRPGFEQNTSAASVDLTTNPGIAEITRGNPDLRPTYGQNFDLDVEDYLPSGGIVEVGVFDKEFTNYIADRIQTDVADPLNPHTPNSANDRVTTFLNIPYAYARGVDVSYHQKFVFLPKPFDGLGIESNLTYVDSHMVEYDAATVFVNSNGLLDKQQSGLLPGTSPITWNLAGFYEDYGVSLRLAAEYVEHSLFGLGGLKSLDTIQDDRLTLDFTSAYQVDKHWQVYFNAKNLLNTPLRYYQGTSNLPIQREFYDATFEAGVRAHF